MEDTDKWRTVDIVLAVLAAVIVAYGVLVLQWSVFVVIALFWFENVVIGALNIAKMLVTGARIGGIALIGSIALAAFFTVHYGGFTIGHGIFVVGLFGEPELGRSSTAGFFDPLSRMIRYLFADRDAWFAAVLITALQGAGFVRWLGTNNHQLTTLPILMFAPYGRVVILHVTIIASGILVLALKAPVLGALLLVGLKLVFDLKPVAIGPKPAELAKFNRMFSAAPDDARPS